ncbi:MAG: CHRD domain-containing protein [Chloroflexia bacterium]
MKTFGLWALVFVLAAVLALVTFANSTAAKGNTPFVAIATANGGRPFTTTLLGANEFPGPGDPDGTGTARVTLNPGQGEVCYDITVANIALPATGAHIHEGVAGTAGPIRVNFVPPDATGHTSGCVQNVPRERIQDIIQNPEKYYVNVHSTQFPPGAVRGQLSRGNP